MLSTAIEAEVAEWISSHAHLTDEAGRRQMVRNGRLPQRSITTGVGQIEIEQPRVHDRRPPAEREKFSSQLLPPYLRKTKSIEELIPWLYLKGVSTGGFGEVLQSLLVAQSWRTRILDRLAVNYRPAIHSLPSKLSNPISSKSLR